MTTLAKFNFMKTLHIVRDLLPRNVMIVLRTKAATAFSTS